MHAYGSECADLVVVDVTDTGSGISAVDLPHVFDRFWRAEKSRSRRTGGSGLGLAIVRKLVEAHGGSVSAVSVDGQGSVFTLRLPTDPARTGSGEWGEAGGPGESQGPSTGMSASATGGCERGSGAGGPERAVGGRGSGAGQA